MEGLHPGYVAELGQALDVDPRVFMRHHRVALWERRTPYGGNTPSLPSLVASSKSFCFDYCQLLHLGLEDNDIIIRCAENERHIAVAKGGGIRRREYDGVGLVHRKASFATQSLPNGGWNGKHYVYNWSWGD